MFPILYDNITPGVVPEDYGIGVLKDAISCEVKEERNGSYELTLKYPSSGAYASYLVPRAIIKAQPNMMDDPQLFRIYKVGRAIGTSFTVYARHISYDLSGFPITTGTADNISDAFQLLQNANPYFIFETDKSTHANFKISEPSSVRSWLGGKTGSILDVFGTGEYKYDNYRVKFLADRGTDRGVTIRYGKNLTKLDNTNDSSNLVTGIIAYWKSTDDDNTVIISDTISTGVTLDVVCVNVIDASDDFENEPTKEQLNNYATKYIQDHEVKRVKQNYKLDFLQISDQLKDRVDLCDTIAIVYEDYNISLTAKCISTTWDVLDEKYTEIELGEPKTNLADTITSINKSLGETISKNEVVSAINSATSIITGNKGGYVVIHDSDEDGEPDELLIMNTPDITTATKVWRWNLSGLGYSSTGYDGNFGLAMTMDGAIVADYVNTGNLIFGQGGNNNGKLEIRDSSGAVLARFDKTGVDVKGHINAETFTADAQNNCKLDILTDNVRISSMGYQSGAILYNNSIPTAGLTNGSRSSQGYYSDGVWVADPNNRDTFSIMRHAHSSGNSDRVELFNYVHDDNGVLQSGIYSERSTGHSNSVMHLAVDSQNYASLNVSKLSSMFSMHSKFGPFVSMSFGETSDHVKHSSFAMGSGGSTMNIDGITGQIVCVRLIETSSRKYKKNIESLTEDEAKKILNIEPVTYDFKDEVKGTNLRGFIAEDVKEVIPEVVVKNNKVEFIDGEQVVSEDLAIDYIATIPYLTKMIQIQQKQIDDLTKRVEELENRKEN